ALALQRLEHVPAAADQLQAAQLGGVPGEQLERRVVRGQHHGRLRQLAGPLAQEGGGGGLVGGGGGEPPQAAAGAGSGGRRPGGGWRATTGARAAASDRIACRPFTKLTSSTTAGGCSERPSSRRRASRSWGITAAPARGRWCAAARRCPPRRRRAPCSGRGP